MGKASRKKRPIHAKARRSNLGFTVVVTAIVVLGVAGASFAVALPQSGRWYPPQMQGVVL